MRKMALLAIVFLAGCSHQPSLTSAQMDAQDDAYCKQQTTQRYADCRKARIAYRQTSANAQLFQMIEFREAHDLMCMGGAC
jgi:PBP1b-binding outer membrane lipoprotein LpoB